MDEHTCRLATGTPPRRGLLAAALVAAVATLLGPLTGLLPRADAATAATGAASGPGVDTASSTSALVLYDTTNTYGFLGQLYAIQTANLTSHFGSWTAEPVTDYTSGQLSQYTAVIYLGSTYDEPLPSVFLDDVAAGSRPVIWSYDNIWQLVNRLGATEFRARYGYLPTTFDPSSTPTTQVHYKSVTLTRDAHNSGLMQYDISDPAKASVLATAVRTDGSELPWAVRAGNLTYIGEIPFSYTNETDRVLAFDDLLFDALAPATRERHRALVRLEDINPSSNPRSLRAAADALYAERVPFGFGVIPEYVEPGKPTVTLRQRPGVVSALKYLQSRGGTLVEHGYTHQWRDQPNPYDGITADDFEFFRVTENPDQSLNYLGPVPEDSTSWAASRYVAARSDFSAVHLTPTIFEFPHYAASAIDYQAVGSYYATRWERGLYFDGLLSGQPPDYSPNHFIGQSFPFAVRDVYGTEVLPEDLGSVGLEPFYGFPTRDETDIIAGAKANLAIRDGVAGFFFHPFLNPSHLTAAIDGMKAAGYTFVKPTSLVGAPGAS